MRLATKFCCATLCLTGLLISGARAAEKEKKAAKPATPAATQPAAKAADSAGKMAGDAAMMAEMAALAKPGPQHAQLAKYAGDFKAEVSMWMDSSQPPMKSTGKLHNNVALGGRYLMGGYEGTFMGMPFHGMSCTGYDNGKKKYFSAWIDDMGTGVMMAEGEADESGKVLTLSGDMYCPQTKGMMTSRQVHTLMDDDTWKMEMYMPGPDGKEMKAMEITYTRVASGSAKGG